jgi:tRNA 2-thiocytidine biosynthesis protein TtcA
MKAAKKEEEAGTQRRSKLYHHLKKWLEKASVDYAMLEEGDRVLVGVSGGMDSLVLLDLLNTPHIFIPQGISLVSATIDPGFDGADGDFERLRGHLEQGRYEYVMEKTDIGPLSHSDYNKKNPCFLCSRLRRKRLFEIADEKGCNKIALAHHKDDIIETLLLNIFYSREISTMVPKQSVFGGKLHIIRPLAYVREPLVKRYGKERGFPVVDNRCPTSGNSRRSLIRKLLDTVEKDNRKVRENIFKAMKHVKTDYLLRPGD